MRERREVGESGPCVAAGPVQHHDEGRRTVRPVPGGHGQQRDVATDRDLLDAVPPASDCAWGRARSRPEGASGPKPDGGIPGTPAAAQQDMHNPRQSSRSHDDDGGTKRTRSPRAPHREQAPPPLRARFSNR